MPREPDNNNYNYYNNDNYAIHFPKAQNYLILSCSHFGFQMTEVLFGHRISCWKFTSILYCRRKLALSSGMSEQHLHEWIILYLGTEAGFLTSRRYNSIRKQSPALVLKPLLSQGAPSITVATSLSCNRKGTLRNNNLFWIEKKTKKNQKQLMFF